MVNCSRDARSSSRPRRGSLASSLCSLPSDSAAASRTGTGSGRWRTICASGSASAVPAYRASAGGHWRPRAACWKKAPLGNRSCASAAARPPATGAASDLPAACHPLWGPSPPRPRWPARVAPAGLSPRSPGLPWRALREARTDPGCSSDGSSSGASLASGDEESLRANAAIRSAARWIEVQPRAERSIHPVRSIPARRARRLSEITGKSFCQQVRRAEPDQNCALITQAPLGSRRLRYGVAGALGSSSPLSQTSRATVSVCINGSSSAGSGVPPTSCE